MTNQLLLTRGLPGSGKTTWARTWVAESPEDRVRVNRDDLRAMLFADSAFSVARETLVTKAQRAIVGRALGSGYDVICDDMHLRPRYVREWVRFARSRGAEVLAVEMPFDVEASIERDAARNRTVGAQAIRRMVEKFTSGGHYLPILPIEDESATGERYEPDLWLPAAAIVDIDGTLARKHPERNIYDLTRVHLDTPIRPVVGTVRSLHRDGLQVVYCSGRDEIAREATEKWLAENVGCPGPLFMRPAGDRRKDAIVKRELFDAHIRHSYNVQFVLDDRNQVVDMWRSLGLACFQVAPGDF